MEIVIFSNADECSTRVPPSDRCYMRNEGGSVVEEPTRNKVIASVSFDWDRENNESAGALCDSNAG